MRSAIVERPLDPAALLAEVADTANGAALVFVGTVRETNEGRAVTGIDYSAYLPMAERELAAILGEVAEEFGTAHIVVEHRLGTLALGDASVVIAVAHARRAPAYEASRRIIEELKRRVPVWKREHYTDGPREWVDPTRAVAPAPGAPPRFEVASDSPDGRNRVDAPRAAFPHSRGRA